MYTFQTTLNKLFESVFFILKRLVSLNEYDKYIIYYNALFGKKRRNGNFHVYLDPGVNDLNYFILF